MTTTVGSLRDYNKLSPAEKTKLSSKVAVVDRRTIFGNPFKQGTRDAMCDRFATYFEDRVVTDEDFRLAVIGLKGMELLCWCAPKRCHADIIAAWLNEVNEEISP